VGEERDQKRIERKLGLEQGLKIFAVIKELGHRYILKGAIVGDHIDLGEGIDP
jgi:hypothetical protein